ncbi:MAG: AEC family transporter [Rubrivivax sp.]
MQSILAVTVPFFALVLCGYLAARRHVLPESAIPGLNGYVLYFALPCLLFRFGAGTPVYQLLNPAVSVVYVASALLIVGFTIAVTLNARVGLQNAAFGALVAAFPNTGFMGVPLLAAMLGAEAAGTVICMVLADLFITSSLCLGLAQAGAAVAGDASDKAAGKAPSGAGAAVKRALRGTLSNPMPWSIALGAVFSATDTVLPEPLATIVRMLADSATPVALFTIGAVLWRSSQHAHHRTPVADYLPVAMIKLFVHPTLVLALAAAAHALGWPLTRFQILVMALAAALPSASNVSLLAERYGADNGRIARIIMSSTVISFVSFTALAWLFGVRPG